MTTSIKPTEFAAYLAAAVAFGVVIWFVSSNLLWTLLLPLGLLAVAVVGLTYRKRRRT